MSDEAPEQESKTEDPSEKRLRDAHDRGDVVKSPEVTTWFVLLGSTLMLATLAGPVAGGLTQSLRVLLDQADQFEVGSQALNAFFERLTGAVLLVALVPSLILTTVAVAGNLIQHRPVLSLDPLKPKFSKINPLEGAKRLVSTEALVNFGKGLVKLGIVAGAIWFVIAPEINGLATMMQMAPLTLLDTALGLTIKTFGAVVAAMTVIAIVDYLYQRNRWWKRLKMTLVEARMEHKSQEGDPEIKGRLRRLRRERSRKRMRKAVPSATVVVTNPTHFAVALLYDRSMSAPKCVAKGMDAIALRIRAMAEEHEVPVIENPPLARALYKAVEIDETIPAEHFKAVAEVIGFVMRLKQKRSWRAAG